MTDSTAVSPDAPMSSTPSMTLLPQFQTTPKGRPCKRPHLEPKALMSHAMENGGRIDISNADVLKDLETRGLKPHRISSAVWGAKHYFGQNIVSERTGRKVTALVVKF